MKNFRILNTIYGSNFRFILYGIFIFLIWLIAPIYTSISKMQTIEEIENQIEKNILYDFVTEKEKLQNFSFSFKEYFDNEDGLNFENLLKASTNNELLNCTILKNDSLFFWSNNINEVVFEDINKANLFFQKNNFYLNLVHVESFLINNNKYHLICYLPFEKFYSIKNEFEQSISFQEYLSIKNDAIIKIDYFNLDSTSNSKSKKILINDKDSITYLYSLPNYTYLKNKQKDIIVNIQLLILFLFIILISYIEFKRTNIFTNQRFIKILIVTGYLIALRYILFYLEFPSRLTKGWIANPEYYSSIFGNGIVSTPIELFISILFFNIIAYKLFEYSKEYYYYNKSKISVLKLISIAFILFLILLLFRGYAASIKSIIFDSTLLYFNQASLFADKITFFMHLNLLLLGFSFLLAIFGLGLLIVSYFKSINQKYYFLFLFIFLQFLFYLFDSLQYDPQATPFIRFIFVTIASLFLYFITNKNISKIKCFSSIILISSFFTIVLLINYSEVQLKDNIKTMAKGVIYQVEEYLDFLVNESFNSAEKFMSDSKANISQIDNYDSFLFVLWTKSKLQNENITSKYFLINNKKEIVGSYSYRNNITNVDDVIAKIDESNSSNPILEKKENRIYAYKQIKINNDNFYLLIALDYRLKDFFNNSSPKFLEGARGYLNSTINISELLIFDFEDNLLVNVYGNINPPLFIQDHITSFNLNKEEDLWTNIELNNEKYITYILDHSNDKTKKIFSVSILEKNFERDLFDFFKVFFIHTFFILLIILFYNTYNYKNIKITNISYKNKLLIWFLLLSLIPLILIGIYLRELSNEMNDSSVFYKLKKRAQSIEKYLNIKLVKDEFNKNILYSAVDDLDIHFQLFNNGKELYNSQTELSKIGIISRKLDPKVYYKLEIEGYNEYINSEKIENYNFTSFYYYGVIKGKYIIIKVDDISNKYLIPFGGNELDVFIFGTFSLAFILIIIVSTILSNQISIPIRNLTEATKQVAAGDLNFVLESKTKGELAYLVEGFNRMVTEIRQSREELAEIERISAWRNMARQVAHEIKNPLTPMKLAVQQLIIAYKDKSNKFNDIFEKVTVMLEQQIDIIKNITNEFTAFAKLPEPQLDNYELLEIIESIQPLFINQKIEYITNSKNIKVLVDKDQLKRVLINMIKNSVQAGATNIKFDIQVEDDVKIFIIDNGKGIKKEILNKIFDADFTTKIEGMGIGLFIAKHHIESFGGSISIIKSEKELTVFLIKLPVI